MANSDKLEMLNGQRKVSELEEKGFKFIKAPGFNRKVNLRHVKVLMANAREKGFLCPIKYITAKEWFKIYPNRKITLESGKVITKGSEELDEILHAIFLQFGDFYWTAIKNTDNRSVENRFIYINNEKASRSVPQCGSPANHKVIAMTINAHSAENT